MRLGIIPFLLLLCAGLAAAQGLFTDPGFEQPKLAWPFTDGYGVRAVLVKENVHGGAQAVTLSTYNVTDRFSTLAQTIALEPGVYEITCWARGTGQFRLAVKGVGMRPFSPSAAWAQYSFVFEITEKGATTLLLEAQGEVTVDDANLTFADATLRAAWTRQQQALEQFNYIPSGYSAQRPAPNAPPQEISDRKPVPITEKVVFFDPRYEGSWNTDCDRIADWFARRGFTVKGAPALAQWMRERIEKKSAYGSVVVMGMGLVPTNLVTPLDHTSLLRRYMDAGGRVVWTGNTALYVAQDETGPAYTLGDAGMGSQLELTCDWGIWTQEAPDLTAAGKRWGLKNASSAIRAARRSEVTLSLSEHPSGAAACWLKTTNPAYPLSGFITSVFGLSGKNTAALEDFYRLALFTGEPVTVPQADAPKITPPPFTLALVTTGQEKARRAFVRGEAVQVTATLTGMAPQGTLTVTLTDGAPAFTQYDQAAMGVERAIGLVNGYAKTLPKRSALWKQTVTPGTPVNLPTADLAIGDYLLHAVLTGPDGTVLAESAHPIALCPRPRLDGIYFGTRGPAPANAYRLEDYLRELQRLNLQGLEMGAPTAVFADALLRFGFTFLPHFDPRPYLTEKRIGKDGKDMPNPWAGGKPGLVGIAGAQARENTFKGMEANARLMAGFPAMTNIFTTSDDFSALAGPDYCAANVQAFKALTGLEAPKAPTAKPGIIPDDDPWLLWNAFLSRDVLGPFNDSIRRGLEAGSPGARVWPVPGGAQWPLFNTYSAQYPPNNFGKTGFNIVGYYCYLGYWAPTPYYLYWSEVARLGNRDLPSWAMPDAGDTRHYLRNSAHMLLAGNTKGIVYFVYDWMKPEGRKEIAELGGLLKTHGPLLAQLAPTAKPAAVLVPFSQSIYNETYPLSLASMAFLDLAQSHVGVELLAEEEVAASPHAVIVLAGITHLRASTVKALETRIANGATVLLDKATTVPIAGAQRLAVTLGSVAYQDDARPAHLAQVKTALAPFNLIAYDSPETTTLVRPFTDSSGGRYLYLVQADTPEEYRFYRRNVYEVATFGRSPAVPKEQVDAFLQEHGMLSSRKDTTMTVTFPAADLPAGWEVVDLFHGKILPAVPAGEGRLQVTATTQRFGGTLLALRPKWTNLRASVEVNRPGASRLVITRALKKTLLPIRVTLTDPSGKAHPELSGSYVVANGSRIIPFTLGRNAPTGPWVVQIEEYGSRQCTSVMFMVK